MGHAPCLGVAEKRSESEDEVKAPSEAAEEQTPRLNDGLRISTICQTAHDFPQKPLADFVKRVTV